MTTRRLNYTGCIRIRRADVQVALESSESGPPHFAPIWDLSSYPFPHNAQIVMEAQAHWTVMRFDFGTIAQPEVPASIELAEFDSADGILFRLKVLGVVDQAGLILGEADGIRPAEDNQPAEGQSFLAVQPADLGDVSWQLSFVGVEPVLLVNDKLGDWRSFMRRAEVRALVIPEVFRQLLWEAVSNPGDAEATDSWQSSVIDTVPAGAGPRPTEDDEDRLEAWISDAVRAFSRKHHLFRGIAAWSEAE